MLFYDYDKLRGADEHEGAKDLLFGLLEKHLPEIRKDASLEHDENGAPYLAKSGIRLDGIFVSLSHSHGVCAAALSDLPIGIDVERVKETNGRESAIDRRFLAKFDIAIPHASASDAFFYKWTCAEACFKASGEWSPEGMDYFHREASEDSERFILCIARKKS